MTEIAKVKFGVNAELPYAMEEAVNRLRINVGFLGKDVRKIMFMSSEPNEGKSFVAMSLWKQMVQAGEKAFHIIQGAQAADSVFYGRSDLYSCQACAQRIRNQAIYHQGYLEASDWAESGCLFVVSVYSVSDRADQRTSRKYL